MTIDRQPRLRRRAAWIGLLPLLAALGACAGPSDPASRQAAGAAAPADNRAVAIFAGGCFWGMEPPFDKLPGVISTTSGYVGGHVANPTYEQVSAGGTGHAEAVQVIYDPRQVGYAKLLDVFWHNIDPVAVFATDGEQRRLAEASKRALQASGRFEQPIATEIVAASTFYPAEGYHQDYYEKNPLRYKFYRFSCGRDAWLDAVWGEAGQG